MSDAHAEARRAMRQALCAAVFVRPLDPGLSEDELREAARAAGAGPGALDEAFLTEWDEHPKDPQGRAVARMADWDTFLGGSHRLPRPRVPVTALIALGKAFEELDRVHGGQNSKPFAMLAATCPSLPATEIELALGLMVSFGRVLRRGEGFAQTGVQWPDYARPPHWPGAHPIEAAVEDLIPIIESILARRTGDAAPTTRPLDRFGLFLQARGWNQFAVWWAMTVKELDFLADALSPASVCVLCGALLEGALVAVAEPAITAGEWKQGFLKNDPKGWKLHELIAQAEAADTIAKDLGTLARILADARNRIHAGRFSTAGKPPFQPPHTNAHEATTARRNLDLLLTAILEWPPIAALPAK